jgi:uncharacterized membrane protein
MKNKALIFVSSFILLFGVSSIAAKKEPKLSGPATQSSLSGVILDKDSNEKLAGVTIQLTETDQKIYSNAKGEFTLEGIEPGTYKVKINCISYKDKEVTVKVAKTQNEKLKILLNPVTP